MYAVFDDASYTETFDLLHTICASPASDCSSSRPPSWFAQRRPVALDISAEPACPVSAPDGKSVFVKPMSALTPSGAWPASASCTACASGFGCGVAPLPPIAETAATPTIAAAATATRRATSVRVESVRKIFTAVLSPVPGRKSARGCLTVS